MEPKTGQDNWISICPFEKARADHGYRYKMPPMEIKIEGAGNGIRTNFVNIHKVSGPLKVPPECIQVL